LDVEIDGPQHRIEIGGPVECFFGPQELAGGVYLIVEMGLCHALMYFGAWQRPFLFMFVSIS
jgi:hypothetical protein